VAHAGFITGKTLKPGLSVVVGPRAKARHLTVGALSRAVAHRASSWSAWLYHVCATSLWKRQAGERCPHGLFRADHLAALIRNRVEPAVESAVGCARHRRLVDAEHRRQPSFGRAEGDGHVAGTSGQFSESRRRERLAVARRGDPESGVL